MAKQELTCDILVIGSGSGGALTATLLAEAGYDVILAEEGQHIPIGKVQSYSSQEIDTKYRNSGLSTTFGKPKVTYYEGCCVGGSSEISDSLYHQPLGQVLDDWGREYQIKNFSTAALEEFFVLNEREMFIEPYPKEMPASAKVLQDATKAMGWQGMEAPRMWNYNLNKRHSMSEVFITRFLKAGGRLMSGVEIKVLNMVGVRATEATARNKRVFFNHVFICGGAVQTPALLRRSGVRANVGRTLRMHLETRVAARFDRDVSAPESDMPTYLVTEFQPNIMLGGVYANKQHMAFHLSGCDDAAQKIKDHKNWALFYVSVVATSMGKIRTVPLIKEPLVFMPINAFDLNLVKTALGHLEELLKRSGVVEIIKPEQASLIAMHSFASCPMGENRSYCAVDSYGKVHDYKNVYLNDASILPSSPGVSPQATVMAIARRNVQHFIANTPPTHETTD